MEYKPHWMIYFTNLIESVRNKIVNNPVSNSIKELFYWLLGVPYPEYLYSDSANDYVVSYIHGKSDENYRLFGMKTPFKIPMGELKTSPELKYACDISKYNPIKKLFLIYAVNKTMKELNLDISYRRRRILTYYKNS